MLVGMMGSGKSTVGRLLAGDLGRPLFDTDAMVEHRTGREVREIWSTDGEAAFRELETATLIEALEASEPSVIAAAGGVVLAERNRAVLRGAQAQVVWLQASIDVLVDRVRHGAHRPLLDGDPEGVLRRMYDERSSLYQEVADAIVSVDNRSALDVARAVARCVA